MFAHSVAAAPARDDQTELTATPLATRALVGVIAAAAAEIAVFGWVLDALASVEAMEEKT
jgi:hypothetical protein